MLQDTSFPEPPYRLAHWYSPLLLYLAKKTSYPLLVSNAEPPGEGSKSILVPLKSPTI